MLARPDLKYARLRRESITVYHPGTGPEFPSKQAVESGADVTRRRLSRFSAPPTPPPVPSPPASPLWPPPSLPDDDDDDDGDDDIDARPQRLCFNVSGAVVETYASTLARFPDSLLGDPQKRQRLWNSDRKEFFLDRHLPSFEAVFQFYQTGILHRPLTVPLFTFIEELEFYEFNRDIIDSYKEKEGYIIEKPPVYPSGRIKKKLWLLTEYPKSSRWARLFALISILFICLSTASFCAETMPEFSHYHCHNMSRVDEQTGEVSWHEEPNLTSVFFLIETTCVLWFTAEFLLRLSCCPSRIAFLCNKLNQVDIVTVIPYAVLLALILYTRSCYIARRSASVLIFRMLRIFRVFKLTRHLRALQIFVICLRASVRELRLFFFLVLMGCVLLAVAVYVVECDHPNTMIDSIPEGIWWAVATMTTVGYGDVYPVGVLGKLVGVICFITGCLVVALPTPPIAANFNHLYRVETGRGCDEQLV